MHVYFKHCCKDADAATVACKYLILNLFNSHCLPQPQQVQLCVFNTAARWYTFNARMSMSTVLMYTIHLLYYILSYCNAIKCVKQSSDMISVYGYISIKSTLHRMVH